MSGSYVPTERLRLADLTCVCCHCQRERTDDGRWDERTPRNGERLTHGICPACLYDLYPDIAPFVRPRASA
jgi:hypothetical protein